MCLQTVLHSQDVPIWQMAVTLPKSDKVNGEANGHAMGNGYLRNSDDHEISDSDEDSDEHNTVKQSVTEDPQVAIGYDDGCIKIFSISDADEFLHVKSLPRVEGGIFFT